MPRAGAKIQVAQIGEGEPMVFNVVVADAAGTSRHRVTIEAETYQGLTGGTILPAACIEAAFRFLLERETKSDILPSFDIKAIKMYFPSFEREFPNYR